MQAAQLTVQNILGVELVKLELGKLTVLTGHNGAGKTSVMEAIRNLVSGGTDATLVRKGQSAGEAVLVLANEDGSPLTIRKRTPSEGQADLEVRGADNVPKPKPKSIVDGLFDGITFNPVEFIQASEREQSRILLEQMNVRLTPEHLKQAGVEGVDDPKYFQMHGLEAIDKIDKAIRDLRQSIGGQRIKVKGAIDRLTATLPPDQPDLAAEIKHVETEIQGRVDALQARRAQIGEMLGEQKDEIQKAAQEKIDEAKERIRKIREKIEKEEREILAVTNRQEADILEARNQANDLYNRYAQDDAGPTAALRQRLGQLRAQQEEAIRSQALRSEIATNEAELQQLDREWDDRDKQLKALEGIRQKLLEGLPLQNVEVKEGIVHVDGISFRRLNTTAQWQLVWRICRLRKAKVPLVLIDGIEFLDEANFEAFRETALAVPDLQFFVTRARRVCQCGQSYDVHAPEGGPCLVKGVPCEAFADRGLTVEKFGDSPRLFPEAAAPAPTGYEETTGKGRRRR